MDKASTYKILIYRLGSLGDTIIALPAFHRIRELFPDAEITLLTNKPISSKASPIEVVVGSDYFFDKTINYPLGTRNIFILIFLLIKIRLQKIDMIINITAARTKKSVARDKIFFRLAGIKKQLGFPENENDYKPRLIKETGLYEWETQRLANRLKALGNIDLNDSNYWDLRLTDIELNTASNFFKDYDSKEKFFAISSGTKQQANNWESYNWVNLLLRLKPILKGWKMVIVGAEDDAEFGEQCLNIWDRKGMNLCGVVSPRISAAVLKKMEFFVGHDSGPIHLAASVQVPCVGIFSARNLPGHWFPRGNNNKIIYHQTDCFGCRLHICQEQKKKCILSISVNEVIQAIIGLITPEISF